MRDSRCFLIMRITFATADKQERERERVRVRGREGLGVGGREKRNPLLFVTPGNFTHLLRQREHTTHKATLAVLPASARLLQLFQCRKVGNVNF